MPDEDCPICNGTGWVCENHMDKPWGQNKVLGECDCGAGKNCKCNPDGEVEWAVIYAQRED